MDGELAMCNDFIRTRIEEMAGLLDGLTPEQLNWRPHEGANSLWTLVTHTLGNARGFILGIAAGRDIDRDRPAEFASAGEDAAALRAEAARLLDEIEAALAGIEPASLDDRITPPQALFGGRPTREIARRYAVLQVVAHAALHLGHAELTRDLAVRTV